MKKENLLFNLLFVVMFLFIGFCITTCGPAKIEQFVTIESNQTAFLVPLEGETEGGQQKLISIDYLNKNKIAAKRISLPLRSRKTGHGWWRYEWLPTMGVLTVNRTPVTREWTSDVKTGTTNIADNLSLPYLFFMGR